MTIDSATQAKLEPTDGKLHNAMLRLNKLTEGLKEGAIATLKKVAELFKKIWKAVKAGANKLWQQAVVEPSLAMDRKHPEQLKPPPLLRQGRINPSDVTIARRNSESVAGLGNQPND